MTDTQPVFLTAEWKYLIMANYVVDPEILYEYIPKGTQLDLWKGRAFVSVVGFQFQNTKVMGMKFPFHTNFEELNLRFYVKREVNGEWRRGVVFVKEVVPKIVIAKAAQWFYDENYIALPMKNTKREDGGRLHVEYSWKFAGAWNELKVIAYSDPMKMMEGTEEEFIAEHYWGYSKQKDGTTIEYQVEHPRWKIYQVKDLEFNCDISGLYGDKFAPYLKQEPESVFLAHGSEIIVRKGLKLAKQ